MAIEAMKQALEALELYQSKSSVQMFDVAAKGLRAAIERAEKPRQWQRLTDDEAIDLLPVGDWDIESTLEFAKAIEAKLKEKNG